MTGGWKVEENQKQFSLHLQPDLEIAIAIPTSPPPRTGLYSWKGESKPKGPTTLSSGSFFNENMLSIMEVTRRVFSSAAIGAAFTPVGKTRPIEPLSAGIKISMQVDEHVTDDDLAWIKQMGVDYLNVQTGKGRATLENFLAIKKRVEAAGLKVWNIPNNDNRNIEEITLNLPG